MDRFDLYKLLRTLQADFPWLLEAKFAVRSFVSRVLKRPHDPDFRALSLFPDVKNALYLDVGANRGQSIEDILMLTRGSCIWSFEPNPLLAEKLKRRFRAGGRVVVQEFGLGDQEGAFKLYVPYYKKWMYDGLASLKRDCAEDWLRERMYGYRERHLTIEEVDCHIRRLDDVLPADDPGPAPFFIKLDVQGFELEALMGSERTLRRHEPVLLIESPEDEACRFLESLGYRPYRFKHGRLEPGGMGVTNTFFITGGKASLLKLA